MVWKKDIERKKIKKSRKKIVNLKKNCIFAPSLSYKIKITKILVV